MLTVGSGGTGAAALPGGTALYTNPAGTAVVGTPLFDAGETADALTVDWANGVIQTCTATDDVEFTLSNPVAGVTYTLQILQDDTGDWAYTWPENVLFPGGTEPTGSGADKTDFIYLYYDGTNYFGRSSLNY